MTDDRLNVLTNEKKKWKNDNMVNEKIKRKKNFVLIFSANKRDSK